jgi:hypothetical protein
VRLDGLIISRRALLALAALLLLSLFVCWRHRPHDSSPGALCWVSSVLTTGE